MAAAQAAGPDEWNDGLRNHVQTEMRAGSSILVVTSRGVLIIDYKSHTVSETRPSSLEGKSITSAVAFAAQPLVALGCSDGNIRIVHTDTMTVVLVLKGGHKKEVTAFALVHRIDEGGTSVWPDILSGSADGSLCYWHSNPDGTFNREAVKAHADPVASIGVNVKIRLAVSSGLDKALIVWSIAGFAGLKRPTKIANLSKKPIVCLSSCAITDMHTTLFIGSTKDQKLWGIGNAGGEMELVELFDLSSVGVGTAKKAKVAIKQYDICAHVLQSGLMASATSNGVLVLSLRPSQRPREYSKRHLTDGTVQILHINPHRSALVCMTVPPTPSSDTMALPVHVADVSLEPKLDQLDKYELKISVTGDYAGFSSRSTDRFVIFDTAKWQRVADGSGSSLVWSVGAKLHFAILQGSGGQASVLIHPADSPSAVTTSLAVAAAAVDLTLVGGPMLGVMDADTLTFYDWQGGSAIAQLPRPNNICWDDGGRHCAMCFGTHIAIFKTDPFKLEVRIHAPQCMSILWYVGMLFVSSSDKIEVVCMNWNSCTISSLASFTPSRSHFGVIEPAAQLRPAGALALIGGRGTELIVLDAACNAHCFSLSQPLWQFRVHVGKGEAAEAQACALQDIPIEYHDTCAAICAARGMFRCASSLPGVTGAMRWQILVAQGKLEQALQYIDTLDPGPARSQALCEIGLVALQRSEASTLQQTHRCSENTDCESQTNTSKFLEAISMTDNSNLNSSHRQA